MKIIRALLVLLYALLHLPVVAEGQIEISLSSSADSLLEVLQMNDTIVLGDTSALWQWRDSTLTECVQKGYFDTQLHLTQKDSNHFILHPQLGSRYRWAIEENTSLPHILKDSAAFDWREYSEMSLGVLHTLVNTGYPFAQLHLENVQLEQHVLRGQWKIDSGQLYYIKGIQINGTAKISPHYMNHYLGLNRSRVFSREAILQISNRLNALPFVRQEGVPIVRFYKEHAEIVAHLDPKSANSFDVLLGIAQESPESVRRFRLTGYARLAFQNLFGQAEKLILNYQGLNQTQSLDINADIPYILHSSIGLGGSFKLYNKTEAFTETLSELYTSVYLSPNSKLRVVGINKSARVTTVDTAYVSSNRKLPAQLNYRQVSFGMNWSHRRLDYAPNPLSGWDIQLSGAIGQNTAIPHPLLQSLTGVNIDSLYTARNARSIRGETGIQLTYYLKIQNRSTLRTSLRGKGIFSSLSPSDNELFRIGGGRSIRGFGEEQFRASKYIFGTMEYRFHTSKNGFLSAFADYGYLQRQQDNTRILLHPLGIGLGFVFETNGGIFQLQYAVGRTENSLFDFTNGQVHLGYLSVF